MAGHMKQQSLFGPADMCASLAGQLASVLASMPLAERVSALNAVRQTLHAVSPFASEPVDCVLWVPGDTVRANDYNPNKVAPPELRLLALSVKADGYTQPIVASHGAQGEVVVDGFHRHRVGREVPEVRDRVHGFLPIVRIKSSREDRADRIASTIRHNRARGRHGVEPMSTIVAELHQRGWDDTKIAKELGMDADEVLRLKQITGLAALFKDREYSKAWEPT